MDSRENRMNRWFLPKKMEAEPTRCNKKRDDGLD